jgi:hypothetical protein
MGALIFVIVVAAIVITLVVGVQKNKKEKKGIYQAADPNFQPPVEAHIEFKSEEPIATPEQKEELVKAKKELKVKKPVSKPKLAAEPVKRSRTKK